MSLKYKITILDKIKSKPPNTTVGELVEIAGVAEDTIYRLKARLFIIFPPSALLRQPVNRDKMAGPNMCIY